MARQPGQGFRLLRSDPRTQVVGLLHVSFSGAQAGGQGLPEACSSHGGVLKLPE